MEGKMGRWERTGGKKSWGEERNGRGRQRRGEGVMQTGRESRVVIVRGGVTADICPRTLFV